MPEVALLCDMLLRVVKEQGWLPSTSLVPVALQEEPRG